MNNFITERSFRMALVTFNQLFFKLLHRNYYNLHTINWNHKTLFLCTPPMHVLGLEGCLCNYFLRSFTPRLHIPIPNSIFRPPSLLLIWNERQWSSLMKLKRTIIITVKTTFFLPNNNYCVWMGLSERSNHSTSIRELQALASKQCVSNCL